MVPMGCHNCNLPSYGANNEMQSHQLVYRNRRGPQLAKYQREILYTENGKGVKGILDT